MFIKDTEKIIGGASPHQLDMAVDNQVCCPKGNSVLSTQVGCDKKSGIKAPLRSAS